jgi:hypothetical protein
VGEKIPDGEWPYRAFLIGQIGSSILLPAVALAFMKIV